MLRPDADIRGRNLMYRTSIVSADKLTERKWQCGVPLHTTKYISNVRYCAEFWQYLPKLVLHNGDNFAEGRQNIF